MAQHRKRLSSNKLGAKDISIIVAAAIVALAAIITTIFFITRPGNLSSQDTTTKQRSPDKQKIEQPQTAHKTTSEEQAFEPPKDISPKVDLVTLGKILHNSVGRLSIRDHAGREMGHGTAFVVHEGGWIVTNYHVIAKFNSFTFRLPSGEKFDVLGIYAVDKEADVAILKVDSDGLTSLQIGDYIPESGTQICVFGNPLGHDSSLSKGIISASRDLSF